MITATLCAVVFGLLFWDVLAVLIYDIYFAEFGEEKLFEALLISGLACSIIFGICLSVSYVVEILL